MCFSYLFSPFPQVTGVVHAARTHVSRLAVAQDSDDISDRLQNLPAFDDEEKWAGRIASGMKHGENIGLWSRTYTDINVNVKKFKTYMSEGEVNPLFKLLARVDARAGA